MVPAFIMTVPAFMVPDKRVSPYVEDPAVNEKSAKPGMKSSRIRSGFAVPSRPVGSEETCGPWAEGYTGY